MDIKDLTINKLEELGYISPDCEFDITDSLLDKFQEVYCTITNTPKSTKARELRYANKLAAMSFVKYKKSHNKLNGEGFLYIIENPAWKGLYKIGVSHDPLTRLRSYQTYSPYRDYKLLHYSFFTDTRKVESRLLGELPRYKNEWVTLTSCQLKTLVIKLNKKIN